MIARRIAAAVAVLLMTSPVASAQLEARVDRTSIGIDESLGLLLRLQGGGGEPDLSLLEADFEILDVRRSARTSIVNGRRDDSLDWWIELAPRREGDVQIPMLRAGAETSEPIDIQVSARRPAAGGDVAEPRPDVFVELEANDPSPYVQGQVLVSARVHSAVPLREGVLSDPEVAGAIVERVGEDSAQRREIAGRSYQVIERQYAVFPQESGELRIPPVFFEGRVEEAPGTRRARRDPFADLFGRSPFGGSLLDAFAGGGGRAVRARSQGLTLDVKPRPDDAADRWWLPAAHVELIEEWATEPPLLRVGEPAERTIAIRASGLSGSQLPELELPAAEGLKQYREPAVDETFRVGDEVIAVKLQKTTVIPTKAGPLTLPAVEVSWWDTGADEARTARLPARTLEVLPGDPAHAAQATPPAAVESPPAVAAEPAAPDPGPIARRGAWATAIAIVAAAFAAGLLHRRRRRTARDSASGARDAASPRAGLAAAEHGLRGACQGADAKAASAALRALALARWPDAPPLSAQAWAERLASPSLGDAIRVLNRIRYAPGCGVWEGTELWNAYREARRSGARCQRNEPGPLPALYPTR